MMDQLVRLLFGVKPSRWAEGGRWHLEFLALPRHDMALAAVAAALVGAWGVWYLYRREGRGIRLPTRLAPGGLRLVVLGIVVAMLLEPALVFTRREMIPSHLIVLKDASESVELRDAYADAAQADRIAAAMGLAGRANDLRQLTRAHLADRVLKAGLLDALAAGGDRRVSVQEFTDQLVTPSATQPTAQAAAGQPPATR